MGQMSKAKYNTRHTTFRQSSFNLHPLFNFVLIQVSARHRPSATTTALAAGKEQRPARASPVQISRAARPSALLFLQPLLDVLLLALERVKPVNFRRVIGYCRLIETVDGVSKIECILNEVKYQSGSEKAVSCICLVEKCEDVRIVWALLELLIEEILWCYRRESVRGSKCP